LHKALVAAHQASPAMSAPGRARTRWAWQVAEVDLALVPREFLCVDLAKLAHLAKAAGSGDLAPHAVPGVTWERVPLVGAKR
jgi:hypothetical protein